MSDGPAWLIAERVLSNDVADYVRFRAVCAAWRACSGDPRAHGVADRRFHPRRWIMLPSAFNVDKRRRFLNVSTGQCIYIRTPDLRSYYLLGPTVEGLLVLCRKADHVVQLLNPLTGQLTDLPCASTMMFPSLRVMTTACKLRSSFWLHGAGLAGDSTVVLLYNYRCLSVAKPGAERWTRFELDHTYSNIRPSVLPFAGRLYCVTHKSILVVEAAANRQPRLVPVADYQLEGGETSRSDRMYPVYDDDGNLIFVHRNTSSGGHSSEKYTTYQAKLDTGNVVRMRGLGGQALFISSQDVFRFRCLSRSVPARVSSSISNDTIYVCNSSDENRPRVVALTF